MGVPQMIESLGQSEALNLQGCDDETFGQVLGCGGWNRPDPSVNPWAQLGPNLLERNAQVRSFAIHKEGGGENLRVRFGFVQNQNEGRAAGVKKIRVVIILEQRVARSHGEDMRALEKRE
jgi:hypothetical protein